MRDLNLQRGINVFAAGSLALAFLGCTEDEGTDADEGKRTAAQVHCDAYHACERADFNEDFADEDECQAAFEDYVEYLTMEWGEACAQAQVELDRCYSEGYLRSCDATVFCPEEYDVYYVECHDSSYEEQ